MTPASAASRQHARPARVATARATAARTAAAATAVALGCAMFAPSAAGAADRDVVAASAAGDTLEQVGDYVDPAPRDLRASIVDLGDGIVDLNENIIELKARVESVETIDESSGSAMITLATDILFDFDSADLSEEAQEKIAELAEDIPAGSAVTVAGHTDSRGEDDYNQDLSERRAEAVAEVLTQSDGSLQIETEGHGSSHPVASETTDGEDDPDGRAQNRRVEITFDD